MSRLRVRACARLTPCATPPPGFFLMRRDTRAASTISAGGFKICLELLVRSEPRLVVEVPYVFEGRTAGESKMNLKEAPGYLEQLKDLRRFISGRSRRSNSAIAGSAPIRFARAR